MAFELSSPLVIGLLVVLLLLLAVQSWRLAWQRGAAGRRARRRARGAVAGEQRALELLRAEGFEVEETQAPAQLQVLCDDELVAIQLRADFLVRQAGRRYVADAKTGSLAASLRHGPTRRQLLEYALVFDVDGVLLVDVEANAIREVRFAW